MMQTKAEVTRAQRDRLVSELRALRRRLLTQQMTTYERQGYLLIEASLIGQISDLEDELLLNEVRYSQIEGL
jgi:hypothetical protein